MNSKEIESLKKQSLHHVSLSPNTKTNIVSSDLVKLTASIKRQLANKREITVLVLNDVNS
jgi:hypothetical protein